MGSKGRRVQEVPRILVISDAVAQTGFSRVCHSIFDRLYKKYDTHILGINYFGDPHPYPYKIYPCAPGGDVFGLGRLAAMIKGIKPHIVFMINDPWIIKDYIDILRKTPVGTLEDGRQAFSNLAAYIPIDGKNIQPAFAEPMNILNCAIGYTQFGIDELVAGGMQTKSVIIPHGIDTSVFKPTDKKKARKRLNLPDDWFIVGCVGRNQPRKRIDLAMQYFAEWAKDKPENVHFYYHGSSQDVGWNIEQMADFFGIQDRLILTSNDLHVATGVSLDMLNAIYGSFDMHIGTPLGEGWGLTHMESMACRIPNIAPDWSGLGEWARDGMVLVPCTSISVNTGGINTVGGIPDKTLFIQEMDKMYADPAHRDAIAKAGYELVTSSRFSWDSIANQFDDVFTRILRGEYVNNHNRSKRTVQA